MYTAWMASYSRAGFRMWKRSVMIRCSGSESIVIVRPRLATQGSVSSGLSTLMAKTETFRFSSSGRAFCSSPSCQLHAGHQWPR